MLAMVNLILFFTFLITFNGLILYLSERQIIKKKNLLLYHSINIYQIFVL